MPFKYDSIGLYLPDQASTPTTDLLANHIQVYSKNGVPAYRTPAGVEHLIGPQIIAGYDHIATNDSGGYLFDLTLPEVLACRHVEIVGRVRSGVGAASDIPFLMYNGDSTATNYRNTYLIHDGTTLGSASANTQVLGFVNGNTAPANSYTSIRIWIEDFQSTTQEKVAIVHGTLRIAAAPHVMVVTHYWTVSPAAITSIRFRPDGYPTDTWVSGSRLTLRGWKV